MTINIRKATLSDLEIITGLRKWLATFEATLNENISLENTEKSDYKAEIAKELCLDNYAYFLLEENNEIRGYICGYTKTDDWWKYEKMAAVHGLWVDENLRGNGFGKALMTEFESWAKSQNVAAITIEVLPENTNAVNLYRTLGYEDFLLYLKKDI